jgi:RimJ/RimL family protein N-acetyltransferase
LNAERLVTPRLLLRPWRAEDEEPLAAIHRRPEVTRYLNRPVDEASIDALLGVITGHWAEHGFGFFAVESREPDWEGRLLGFIGVAHPTYLPELAARPELGWRLTPDVWGRGLAREGAVAARDHAFAFLELPELISVIHPDNERSWRLARRLGMEREGSVDNPILGRQVDVWRLARPQPQAPGCSLQ